MTNVMNVYITVLRVILMPIPAQHEYKTTPQRYVAVVRSILVRIAGRI